jgi:hypothetical protein
MVGPPALALTTDFPRVPRTEVHRALAFVGAYGGLRIGELALYLRAPGLRIHDLRHTAVARWIAAVPPRKVAVRAGHTSTTFVLDRYGRLFPESAAALRDRLDELFVPATDQPRNTTA